MYQLQDAIGGSIITAFPRANHFILPGNAAK